MCNCKPCKCPPNVRKGDPGKTGPAGPAPQITPSIELLQPGETPDVVVTGVSPVLGMQFRLPAAPSPVFGQPQASTLAPGSQATASIDNANPLAPILALGIPRGADGANGFGTAFTTLDAFVMPSPGFPTGLITVGDNRMVEVGTWVKSEGTGSWFIVAAKAGDDQVQLRNPGSADLLPFWGIGVTNIPTNLLAGLPVPPGQLFVVVGAPGLRGIPGQNGATPGIVVVYEFPTAAPASPELGFVFYSDEEPPNTPTVFQPAYWDGNAWQAGPNLVGPRGSVDFFQAGDPNTSQPAGSQNGDVVWRQTGSTLQAYRRVTGGSWTLEVSFALQGQTTQAITHSAPGALSLDAAYFSHAIEADKDIELGVDDANYNGQGQWTASILNTDASSIGLTYAAGVWERNPAVTLPASIDDGDTLILRFARNMNSGRYVITEAFVTATV